MGLDTSHDCWHGPYSAFMRWRVEVAQVAGINLMQMNGFGPPYTPWASLPASPLHTLLDHSDCDGEIAARDCAPLADALEVLIPKLSPDAAERAIQFVKGLRKAAAANEPVEFH